MTIAVKKTIKNRVLATAIAATLMPCVVYADKTDNVVNNGKSRLKAAAASQKRIDALADATDKIVGKYNQERKNVESLKVYNDRMRRTVAAQKEAMEKLVVSVEDASLIERQIVPLMLKMIDGLDQFIKADLPIKKEERLARIQRIRGYLNNANISAAERFRQVLTAYNIETDIGNEITVYSEELPLEEGNTNVNILQVGRVGLFYQTFDGKKSGRWNKGSKSWEAVDSSYNQGIANAILVAQEKASPNLMDLPFDAPEKL